MKKPLLARLTCLKKSPGDLLQDAVRAFGLDHCPEARFAESIPFSVDDTTAGAENELQAVVVGSHEVVDLPLVIRESNYYQNLVKRARTGDTSRAAVIALDQFIDGNAENVWENSWVRFPRNCLSRYAKEVFRRDLLADKTCFTGPMRKDIAEFTIIRNGEPFFRLPVSYLLKLALADSLSAPDTPPVIRSIGERFMGHFTNDNTSPEIFSFFPVRIRTATGMGKALAEETLTRYLLTHVLTAYANEKFRLSRTGQEAMVYFAPHPPVRQKQLNGLVSDSFYRKLFMSPCLSGWDRGEAKHHYMKLCHQVLSRSQLNAIAKLKEAGIILNNLVVLPNMSNICLANNGTHVSIGSMKLSRLLQENDPDFSDVHEKFLGDLVIKIVEHFLPLFVGTYSAAPYRLDFTDFHPEKALGFLPHELDFTHLRMIWRRWKNKADLKLFGRPFTPFGPVWLDRLFSRFLGLRGDFVNDFRLIDYLVALMSTDQSPALDGTLGNDQRLKEDQAAFGVFDPEMPIYLLYRLRRFADRGFSGFEGRYYSLFHSIAQDMTEAVNLQVLVTCLAYKYVLKQRLSHADIPDTPFTESERRQIFFGAAIGIPTFFVHGNTRNRFLKAILKKTDRIRFSRRYRGYLRIYHLEYRRALVRLLREDASDLIALMGLEDTLQQLADRIEDPQTRCAAGKLARDMMAEAGGGGSPMNLRADDFNLTAERYYRNSLRKRYLNEAWDVLKTQMKTLQTLTDLPEPLRNAFHLISGTSDPLTAISRAESELHQKNVSAKTLRKLIHLTLLTIQAQQPKGSVKEPHDFCSVKRHP